MVASAQVFLLLFYSMSGFWKVAGAIEQLWIGETSALAPSALARTILARIHFEAGRMNEGKAELRQIFSVDPNYAAARELEKQFLNR